MSDPAHKPFRPKQAGVKFEKKKAMAMKKAGLTDQQKRRNFKAFGFKSTIRAKIDARFANEREMKRQHFVMPVRETAEPPPLLVAVAGPPGVGKSTVIRSLVKNYTKMNVKETTGPISIVTGKARRITLLEVPNDMGSMLDAAKTADLVLLVIDASFGFEMETFEFLNILKTHGFPKVIGILTHLDAHRDNKKLRTLKKLMKDRFWSEVCKGSKLFYFSGVLYGKYLRREVINLGRFISVTKPTPLSWRVAHGFMLADRVEDLTPPGMVQANPLVDRTVALYGYVRGTNIKPGQNVHVSGVGDFAVDSLTIVDDPLPLAKAADEDVGADGKVYRRTLKEKDRQIYAPMADVGEVVFDKDAVYITIKDNKVTYTPAHMLLADAAAIARANDEDEAASSASADAAVPGSVAARLAQAQAQSATAGMALKDLSGDALVRSLQSGGAAGGVDVAMETHHAISLFKGAKSVTAAQFDRMESIRKRGYADDALPASAAKAAAEDDDDDEDDGVGGLAGARAAEADDVYERMQVKEVVGADGRKRRQVIFAGDAPEAADDSDDDDEEGYDQQGGLDEEDGYSDAEEDDVAESDADDAEEGDEGDWEGDYADEDAEEEEDEVDEEDDEDAGPVDASQFFSFGSSASAAAASASASRGKASKGGARGPAAAAQNDDLGSHAADWKDLLADRARSLARTVPLSELVYGSDAAHAAGAGVAANGADAKAKAEAAAGEDAKKGASDETKSAGKKDDDDEDDGDDFFKPRVAITASSTLNAHARAGALVHNPRRAGNEAGSTDINGEGAGGAGVTAADTVVAGDDLDSTLRLRREADMAAWGTDAVDKDTIMRNRFVTGDWSAAVGVDPAAAAAAAAAAGEGGAVFGGEGDDVAMEGLWGARDLASAKKRGGEGLALAGGEGGAGDSYLDDDGSLGTGIDAGDEGAADSEEAARRRLEAKIKQKNAFLADLDKRVAGELEEDEAEEKQAGQRDPKEAKKFSRDNNDDIDFFAAQKAEARRRAEARRAEFAGMSQQDRLLMEGALPGKYVRILVSRVPCEFVQYFDRRCPVLVGALLPSEQNLGFVQTRMKRHRWHPRVLKTNEPLVFSIGWRRFQSLPIFHIEDQNGRQRYLKYSPEHMHCLCTFYGPLTTPNTGIMAFKAAFSSRADGRVVGSFRVSGTGTVLEMKQAPHIVKKLKLVGLPLKVMKNTAYIQDMFTSAIEAARFEGAKVRTVSGIRGQIKKAVLHEGKEGTIRATFEDKILMSDIVTCRTWTDVKPYEYYNPVSSMLAPDKSRWQGMRTIHDIRAALALPVPSNPDSEYKPIEREERHFNSLKIPQSLQRALPFASKPKMESRKRALTLDDRRAQLYEREDAQAESLMRDLQVVAGATEKRRREAVRERRAKHAKELEEIEERKAGNDRLRHIKKVKNRMAQQGKKFVEKRYSTGHR